MKKFLFGLFVFLVSMGSYRTASAENLSVSFTCGSETIEGGLTSMDIENTIISMTIVGESGDSETRMYTFEDAGVKELIIDPTQFTPGFYTVDITATLGEQSSSWMYKAYFDDNCESFTAIKERMVTYAVEAKEYFDNVQDVQQVPAKFLNTGLSNWIDKKMAQTAKGFAVSAATTYHDVPEWTGDPNDTPLTFEEQYAFVPDEYRDAYAYLQFKGLLVPIQLPGDTHTEQALLSVLNNGMMMAPETADINAIGNVKMMYSHSLSFTPGPFSGIGSYLSLFSEIGDTVTLYVKTGYVSYEKRTYTVKNKLEIKPEQTDLIKNFQKPGVDSIALITCKSGDILGSTQGREIMLLERVESELGAFQKEMIRVSNIPSLQEQKQQFDGFLSSREFDEDDLVMLVKTLEKAEEENKSPLHKIALYGKYMASYEALYN